MKSYLFVSKIRIQAALAYRFNVVSTILIQCLVMYGFPAPASFGYFMLFLPSFATGYLINWILAALLGLCAFKTLRLGPLANAKGFIMKLLSGSIFPLWFFPAGFRKILELLPFMNIYQLPLGIYTGQYAMNEILLRTALQLFWCVVLWLLFDVLQKKMSAAVLIQGG